MFSDKIQVAGYHTHNIFYCFVDLSKIIFLFKVSLDVLQNINELNGELIFINRQACLGIKYKREEDEHQIRRTRKKRSKYTFLIIKSSII